MNVAIIGCGMFGAEIALRARRLGLEVSVFEAKDEILSGASKNNQNRLHLGFHYPRDLETGRQSIRGFKEFTQEYRQCIAPDFPNAYFVADKGSFTSAVAYMEFCERLGVPFTPITTEEFPVPVKGAKMGILCGELVYDCRILRDLVWERLLRTKVHVVLGARVVSVARAGRCYRLEFQHRPSVHSDVVINCSYAEMNRLTEQLGHFVQDRQFEYTVVPIIRLNIPKVGITIMDGPFMTLLPHGKSNDFLLYNVERTVVARSIARQLDQSWLTPSTAPFASMDRNRFFRNILDECEAYVPALRDSELTGFLEGPRMILAQREDTDARPSIVAEYEQGYFTVFAGKIDHCMWIAEDIQHRLGELFGI